MKKLNFTTLIKLGVCVCFSNYIPVFFFFFTLYKLTLIYYEHELSMNSS